MAGSWVELRVHGVSGTPPEEMLDVHRVRQVTGDELGRTFRRADPLGEVLTEPDGRITEAYHWGQMTSGSFVQGLWLLLAPFGLVNAAQFMLEPAQTAAQRRWHAVAGAMLRLVGLGLTVLFVLAASVITFDLWAWQRSDARDGWAYLPAMLGPLALLVVYRLLVRSRIVNQIVPVERSDMPVVPVNERRTDLVRPGFFEGAPEVVILRRLHVAAGLVLVGALGFAPAALRAESFGLGAYRVCVGLLVLTALATVLLGDPERSGSTEWAEPGPGTARLYAVISALGTLLMAAGGIAVFGAAIHLASSTVTVPSEHYPGTEWAALLVIVVVSGALVVLALANGALAVLRRHEDARSRRAFAPYAKGMACTLVATLGVFLGVGYAAAFTTAIAASLSTDDRPVGVPELLSRVVYAWGVAVLVALVIAVIAWFGLRRSRPRLERYVHADLKQPDGLRVPLRWMGRITTAMWLARLKNRAARIVTVLVLVGLVLTAVALIELAPQFTAPGADPVEAPGFLALLSASTTWPAAQSMGGLDVPRDVLITIGTTALTGLAAALVVLGRTALQGESTRRGVNVVWDVISFWPRSAHPFVPVAYSQRAVADLESRIRTHLATGGVDEVVLCGHSQGSLLSFAALLRLKATHPTLLPRIGLVTFGSQLQVMFSRGFPAYVNHHAIEGLWNALGGRWVNLYRDTDHLAGPVLSWGHRKDNAMLGWLGSTGTVYPQRADDHERNGPDWRLYDPPVPAHADLDRAVLLPLRRHGDYWLDPAWDAAVAAVRPGLLRREQVSQPPANASAASLRSRSTSASA